MSLLHVVVLVPFILAVLIPCLPQAMRRIHGGWMVLPPVLLLFVYFLYQIPDVQRGENSFSSLPWIPSLGIEFNVVLDGLSLLFALLITGIGSLVVLYSIFYMDKKKEAVNRFYTYLLMFMGAMLGVVISDNLMVLYGFWELTSISSFLLIAFWDYRERSRYGALKSMLITVFGGMAMLGGFILIYVMTGTFSFRAIIQNSDLIFGHPLMIPSIILILLGAFTKSAQFPFHIWLPDAMEAPTPVSAYLHSATMVKAGLYIIARFTPVFAGEMLWFMTIILIGIITMIFGSIKATKQFDLKGMLAYSTISQLGLMMTLFGLGAAGYQSTGDQHSLLYVGATTAAVFHLINHAVFKASLFMVVGIVDHETGTRDIRKLGGLMRMMPITFSVALIGTLAMAGIPPLNGFLSKEMFFTAVLNAGELDIGNAQMWGILIPVVAWVGSIFTFVYCMILLLRTFTGKLQLDRVSLKPHEAGMGLLVSPVILGSLAIIFGLFPNLLSYTLIEPALAAIHPGSLAAGEKFLVSIHMWHGWTAEIFMTIGVAAAGIIVYRLYRKFKKLSEPLSEKLTLNRLYDQGLALLDKGSNRLTSGYMTGSVRHYLIYIFAFMIISLSITMWLTGGLQIDLGGNAPISLYEGLIVLVLISAALAVPFSKSRITSIVLTGTVGYMVSLLFIIFRAPDLALTQMIVETVSVTLFLLCFYHLPKLKKEMTKLSFKMTNFLISLGVGVIVILIALSSLTAGKSFSFQSIADYFLGESYAAAGGKNVVNVILVDFRGFDTMLEITVLGIAALGIYSMIRLSMAPDSNKVSEQALFRARVGMKSNDMILKTISKVVVFIILTFSIYLFLSGHNEPGGGFIGGLMTSSALVLVAIAFGMDMLNSVVPVNFRKMIAAGMTIAYLTGIGSLLFDAPFLSHAFGYRHLPLLGEVELATAVIFDLGVYLTVVGVTMSIIISIGRDNKSWK